MDFRGKATEIAVFDLKSVQMRTFHMTWFAFFLCFFGWFGIAPLMAVVREDLSLSTDQVGNTIIASVAITVLARLFVGWLWRQDWTPQIVYLAAGTRVNSRHDDRVWPTAMSHSSCSVWRSVQSVLHL